jgi:hypothetical protein
MFEVGERIICIDEDPFILIDNLEFSSKGITLNKEYVVTRTNLDSCEIRNNANSYIWCENKLFASRAMYRRMKIEKIRKKQNLTYRICTKLGIK